MSPMASSDAARTRGFAILETVTSLGAVGMLLVSVFTIAFETYAYLAGADVQYAAENEASQTLSRMTELLRKSGWSTLAGVTYPRAVAGGAELEFRVRKDLGWSPKVYRIRRDANDNLRVYDGESPIWHLGRHVTSITFATHHEDVTLAERELGVALQTQRLTPKGDPIGCSLSGSIDMRN